jgi:hypothetical protein
MWRGDFDGLAAPLADGHRVVAAGGCDYYPGSRAAAPSVSLAVTRLRVAGEGDLLAQLERLRRSLHTEGLFEPQKRLARRATPTDPSLLDGPGGESLQVVAHGSYTPGDPLDVTVRHVPFVPEAAVMGDHVPPSLLAVSASLLCLAVLAVWAPRGLRASWRRRRRMRPRLGRVEGAELRVPVALRAGTAAVLLRGGAAAGVFGTALAGVSAGMAVVGPFLLVALAWMLVPAATGLAIGALYRYAERAPVKIRPPARVRVLPRGAVQLLRASALVIGIAGGFAAIGWEENGSRPPSALTGAGTAVVVDTWTAQTRSGHCLGRALVAYTAAELPYRTTLEVECDDLPVLEEAGRIDVRWYPAAPEHVRWVR